MSDELKPCPACNSKRNLHYGTSKNPLEQVVGCSFCEVEIHENNWNTRPIEDALQAKLAIAIEALESIQSCAFGLHDHINRFHEKEAREALAKIKNFTDEQTKAALLLRATV